MGHVAMALMIVLCVDFILSFTSLAKYRHGIRGQRIWLHTNVEKPHKNSTSIQCHRPNV
jgi:hypothetical protein